MNIEVVVSYTKRHSIAYVRVNNNAWIKSLGSSLATCQLCIVYIAGHTNSLAGYILYHHPPPPPSLFQLSLSLSSPSPSLAIHMSLPPCQLPGYILYHHPLLLSQLSLSPSFSPSLHTHMILQSHHSHPVCRIGLMRNST